MTCCLCLVTQSCLTLQPRVLQPARLLCPWGFSRQECWGGLSRPTPGDLPNPGIEPRSTALQADSLPAELPRKSFIELLVTYSMQFEAAQHDDLIHVYIVK